MTFAISSFRNQSAAGNLVQLIKMKSLAFVVLNKWAGAISVAPMPHIVGSFDTSLCVQGFIDDLCYQIS